MCSDAQGKMVSIKLSVEAAVAWVRLVEGLGFERKDIVRGCVAEDLTFNRTSDNDLDVLAGLCTDNTHPLFLLFGAAVQQN